MGVIDFEFCLVESNNNLFFEQKQKKEMSNSPSTFLPYLVYVPGTTINELKDGKLLHCLFAELIGTLFLVLIGCGSCMGHGYLCPSDKDLDMKEANVDLVRIASAFGLVVATLAQSIGHI